MGVKKNNFRHLFTGDLPLPTQAQHMFGVFPTLRVTNTGLTGKERLKALPLQAVQQGDGGYICVSFTTRFVFVLAEYAGYHAKQLLAG